MSGPHRGDLLAAPVRVCDMRCVRPAISKPGFTKSESRLTHASFPTDTAGSMGQPATVSLGSLLGFGQPFKKTLDVRLRRAAELIDEFVPRVCVRVGEQIDQFDF